MLLIEGLLPAICKVLREAVFNRRVLSLIGNTIEKVMMKLM